MKRTLLAVLSLALALCLALPFAQAEETAAAGGLSAALNQAMQDEQDIGRFYEAVLKAFPGARPFEVLIRSETAHVRLLERVARDNGVLLQVTPRETAVPATLEEALALAAQLEQDDIALYSGLLEDKTFPQGAVQAFQRLKQASERHLNALQRVSASGDPQGGLPGNGRMNGGMFSDDESFPGSAFRQPRGGRGFRRDGSFMQRMMPGRQMRDRMLDLAPDCPCENCPRR